MEGLQEAKKQRCDYGNISSYLINSLLKLEASEHYNTRDLVIQRFDNYAFS
jgi:hypothetical protein